MVNVNSRSNPATACQTRRLTPLTLTWSGLIDRILGGGYATTMNLRTVTFVFVLSVAFYFVLLPEQSAARSCPANCTGVGAIYFGDIYCGGGPPANPYPGYCRDTLPPGCSSGSGGWTCQTVFATGTCRPEGESCKFTLPPEDFLSGECW